MEEEKKSETPQPEQGAAEKGKAPSLKEQIENMKAEVEEASREKNQFRELFQRTQADLVNYKRRSEEEREEHQKYANARLVGKLLPVMDEFKLAIGEAEKGNAEGPWLEGIKLIHRKLSSFLESENVTSIQAEGTEFDPLEHEAMAYEESTDLEEGQILAVVREGYKMRGRVIRPALVILAKKPTDIEVEEQTPHAGKETEDA